MTTPSSAAALLSAHPLHVRKEMKSLRRLITGPYKSILETTRAKKKTEAITWAEQHYEKTEDRDIAARFALILEDQLSVPLKTYRKETSFLDDLGMDELEPVEVAMAIEEEFQIPEIKEEDATNMLVFDDVVSYLILTAKKTRCEPVGI